MSGVIYFWQNGDYLVSVVWPVFLFRCLSYLFCISYCIYTVIGSLEIFTRAMYQRIVEFVGRWSMIDVFVVALHLFRFNRLRLFWQGQVLWCSCSLNHVCIFKFWPTWDNFYASQNTNKSNDFSSPQLFRQSIRPWIMIPLILKEKWVCLKTKQTAVHQIDWCWTGKHEWFTRTARKEWKPLLIWIVPLVALLIALQWKRCSLMGQQLKYLFVRLSCR